MIPIRRKPRRLNIYVGLESDTGTEWGRVGPDEHGPAGATGGWVTTEEGIYRGFGVSHDKLARSREPIEP